jgi:hypothetical protein
MRPDGRKRPGLGCSPEGLGLRTMRCPALSPLSHARVATPHTLTGIAHACGRPPLPGVVGMSRPGQDRVGGTGQGRQPHPLLGPPGRHSRRRQRRCPQDGHLLYLWHALVVARVAQTNTLDQRRARCDSAMRDAWVFSNRGQNRVRGRAFDAPEPVRVRALDQSLRRVYEGERIKGCGRAVGLDIVQTF